MFCSSISTWPEEGTLNIFALPRRQMQKHSDTQCVAQSCHLSQLGQASSCLQKHRIQIVPQGSVLKTVGR